jgi:hypothetical protein
MPAPHQPDKEPASMKPNWQKYYNWLVIIASRGVGSLTMTALFLLKKYYLPADEFATLGHSFAGAMMIASPIASPAIMMMSRRIIQSRELGHDRDVVLGWSALSCLAACGVMAEDFLSPNGVSDLGFIISIFAFLLTTVLNSQYIIWLNESDQARRSLVFILLFLSAIPLSIAVRAVTGIGQHDRSFSVEAVLLSLPVLINVLRTRGQGHFTMADLYAFSSTNYFKYFAIILFYTSILWVDWTIGKAMLPEQAYLPWANDRILFERVLLPVVNIVQVTLLWQLLRNAIGARKEEAAALTPQGIMWFRMILACIGAIACVSWLMPLGERLRDIAPLFIGYMGFGLLSIFLDFYQAKSSVRPLLGALVALSVARIIVCLPVIHYFGVHGYSLAWALTSIMMVWFVFEQSKDQIKIGRTA